MPHMWANCIRLTFPGRRSILFTADWDRGIDVAVYLDLTIGLNFLVDFLLLVSANRLAGADPGFGRAAAAAGIGGIYAGICLIPGFRFLGNYLWRFVCLTGMSAAAFGIHADTFRRGSIFMFLSMALGGISLGFSRGGIPALLVSALCLCALSFVSFREKHSAQTLIPVELQYGGKSLRLTGLRDTGNTLRDPLTGQQVLVAGAEVAGKLVGLTEEQLRNPVETVRRADLPGLRLIPYQSVGQAGKLMLALRFPRVRVGKWRGSAIVAFAPEGVGSGGTYQILTGGIV